MGVVNVTPDSFSDGGLYALTESAICHAARLIEEGAGMLDIGGESTRPGSDSVSVAEELRRVIPVVQALASRDIPISVDTSKPEVMLAAIQAGAVMINDVNALRATGALEVVAAGNVAACLMHMQGEPHNMQTNPRYRDDVVTDVKDFLQLRLNAAQEAGISLERLVIDPGFGFGKTTEHNFELLNRLDSFAIFELPIVVGLSRKSMICKSLNIDPSESLNGTTVLNTIALSNGCDILRVHDVKEAIEAIRLIEKTKIQL